MSPSKRIHYYQRIVSAYLTGGQSQLTFWHEPPKENQQVNLDELGEYYMDFPQKARYEAHLDSTGIPMLDYRGQIGLQYNPIAISQWGLGNYNLFRQTPASNEAARTYRTNFLAASDWLCSRAERNPQGVSVWNHHFDWEYRTPLKAPWYSGLAQGQGISLLLRAHRESGLSKYLDSANLAFESFRRSVADGGVLFVDGVGNVWFEEYIVSPPTHILNGFMWAAWGVRDYFVATKNAEAGKLFEEAVQTLRMNLQRYDLGFWSLYEQSGTRLPMVASPFYHQLHIVQLRTMHRLTGEQFFADYAERWQGYVQRWPDRARALCYKSLFKLCYY